MKHQSQILPLTKQTLKQAERLVNTVFNDEETKPSKELKASIFDKDMKSYRKRVDDEVITLDYYVALHDDKVVGIVGLYLLTKDCKDTVWLGWYCVSPLARGMGVGGQLLHFAIDKAKEMGKHYLALYTSTDDNEKAAQLVYEKNGFHIIAVENQDGYDILYRRKTL